MPHRSLLSLVILFAVVALTAGRAPGADQPNIVVIFFDDLGYGDLGCYGNKVIRTPRMDRMAAEGMRFTSFYAQNVCGPSRAALLTGCYPIRVAEPGNEKHPHTIIHPQEVTIAEVLKHAGYATGMFGKWHNGGGGARKNGPGSGPFPPELMPNAQGFDYWFGTPLHNGFTREVTPNRFVTELHRNAEVVARPAEMDTLTKRTTDEAIAWIREHKGGPFFAYVPYNMTHVVLGASEGFKGKSRRGLYGDAVEELDHSVGRILDTLADLGVDDRTLVLLTSDNGPWIEEHLAGPTPREHHYGTAGPLRGSKMMTWEGGVRVPGVVRWPGHIPAGVTRDGIVTTMDLLPTFAKLTGATLPGDRKLDGVDMSAYWLGESDTSPRDTFYYYGFTHLQAVRQGRWKLVLPRPAKPPWTSWYARMIDAVPAPQLYDLAADVGEQHDVASAHPDKVRELMALVERVRSELGDYDRVGSGARFFDDGAKRPSVRKWADQPVQVNAAPPTPPDRSDAKPCGGIYDHPKPLGDLRFDFESGDAQGWRVVDGAFEALINDRSHFHHTNNKAAYNKQGTWFMTTLERAGGGRGNDPQTGVVESPVFRITGDRAAFLLGGGGHADTYVALVDAESGDELLNARGTNGEIMRPITWDVSKWKGRPLLLRLVDRNRGGWGHVTFDDFSAEGKIDEAATEKRWAALKSAPAPSPAPSTSASRQPAPPAAAPPVESDITHSFLATGSETYIVDDSGKVTWRFDHPSRDGWVLDNGNVLLALNPGKRFGGGGAIVEVTPSGEVVFAWKGTQKEVQAVQPLDNGRILVIEGGPGPRLLELTREGEIALQFPLSCQTHNVHMQSRMGRKLPNGHYLVPHLLDFAVKEYDAQGNVIKVLGTDHDGRQAHDWPFTAIRLANGNTLVGCTHGNKVVEHDPDGRRVWQVTNDDLGGHYIRDACGVQRLPNGNTVIAAYAMRGPGVKLLEVSPDKRIVWTYHDDKRHGIHHFQILTTNGAKLDDAAMK